MRERKDKPRLHTRCERKYNTNLETFQVFLARGTLQHELVVDLKSTATLWEYCTVSCEQTQVGKHRPGMNTNG